MLYYVYTATKHYLFVIMKAHSCVKKKIKREFDIKNKLSVLKSFSLRERVIHTIKLNDNH